MKDATLNRKDNIMMLKLVGVIAGPIALQSLIASSLNLVDNLMIGGLGELELNAVGVSVQIFYVYWMFLYGFSSGSATYMAQFFGVKEYNNIRKTAGFTIAVCMAMGVLLFIAAEFFPRYILRVFTKYPEVIAAGVPYLRVGAPCFLLTALSQPLSTALRATQQTTRPLEASVAALCLNTFLNYCFIYGHLGMPELGVAGAALATVLSRAVELAIIMAFAFGTDNPLKGPLREFLSFGRELSGRIFRNALPTTINETMWGLGTSLYVAAFARISISAGAAIQACNTINSMFSMAAFSVGDAILILVGQKLGEGKKDRAYSMAKNMVRLGVIVGVALGSLALLFGRPVLSLFDFTDEGAADAWHILIVYGATLWLEVYNATYITGALRCGGDTRFAMIVEVGAVWIIGVPAAFITSLYLHFPIYLAVLCVKLSSLIESVFLTWRFTSRKWLNNVIKGL